MTQRFRILSLSGGGARGVFSAAVLCELHDALRTKGGRDDILLADYFDLIVGTSTGGLIALGLGFKHAPARLLQFYLEKGSTIFPRRTPLQNLREGRWWKKPGYDAAPLRAAVEELLGKGRKLGDAYRPLVLPAVLAHDAKPGCLKTQHHDDFYIDWEMDVAEAALATAAAPIFFPAVDTPRRGPLLDGGLWANCPVLVGIIEAMRFFGRKCDDIDILSIGTVRPRFELPAGALNGGLYQYMAKDPLCILDLLFEGQRATAMNAASLLVNPGALVEIDDVAPAGKYKMNNASPNTLAQLEHLGRQAARNQARLVVDQFFNTPAPAWNPTRRPLPAEESEAKPLQHIAQ